jgi:signal transduction histidine kinase/CheY-like chemotaxis protein
MTGYSKDELMNLFIENIIYSEDRLKVLEDLHQIFETERISDEYRFLTKEGQMRNWSFDIVKLSGTRILGFLKDITERNKMIEQIRQMEKMDAIGQLAGGIAHDFNNQIAVIMGYSEILVASLKDEKLQKYAKNILASSRRSNDLTKKLLAFAHKGLSERKSVNMHDLISEVVDFLNHSFDKRIVINSKLKAEYPYVEGDPNQIQNMLLNLAINARDAMPDGGSLTFESSIEYLSETYCQRIPYEIHKGLFLEIKVSDTGNGIDDANIRRIFEPFFTTKSKGKGTGMGLASVFGAVSNHGGSIEVKSCLGKGSTFCIYFPIGAAMTERENDRKSLDRNKGDNVILLVDDDELIRQMGLDFLSILGYSIITCNNGREAVEYYQENWQNIDLVILDMIMPEMGGKDVFRILRKINSDVRIILSSGFSLGDDIKTLLEEGAEAFIGKPFELNEFSDVLSKVMNK